jgi:hypothetical protein
MNPDVRVQSKLERLLAEAPISRAPDQLRADIASATSRKRQRPPWLTSLKEPPMRYRSQLVVGSPALRLATVVAVTAALTLALAGAVIAGASLLPSPVPVPQGAPTWVTGNVQPASSCSEPPPVSDGDVLRSRNVECSPQTWTSSDPRLTGEVSRLWNWDTYQTAEGSISVGMDAAYLRNDDGGWTCSASCVETGSGTSAKAVTGTTFDCVGDGGYSGLSAILVLEDAAGFSEDIVGLIFSGDLPPLPEAPAAQ